MIGFDGVRDEDESDRPYMEWIYKGNCLINKIVFLERICGDGYLDSNETCDIGD